MIEDPALPPHLPANVAAIPTTACGHIPNSTTMAPRTSAVFSGGKTGGKKHGNLAPERERFMQACADIAHQLIQDHEENDGSKVTNLNSLRGQVSKKYKLSTIPPLTAIMAAIPEHYKKYINWKLIQKPVRTSSGIAVVAVMCKPHRCPHIAYVGLGRSVATTRRKLNK